MSQGISEGPGLQQRGQVPAGGNGLQQRGPKQLKEGDDAGAEAGYIKVARSGEGRGSHTVCRSSKAGTAALREYQRTLLSYFNGK